MILLRGNVSIDTPKHANCHQESTCKNMKILIISRSSEPMVILGAWSMLIKNEKKKPNQLKFVCFLCQLIFHIKFFLKTPLEEEIFFASSQVQILAFNDLDNCIRPTNFNLIKERIHYIIFGTEYQTWRLAFSKLQFH